MKIKKLCICISIILTQLCIFAKNNEYPDTVELTHSQVYGGDGAKLVDDFSKELKVPKESFLFGACKIKIYFNQEGGISNILITSKTASDELKDSISSALYRLPDWKVDTSSVAIREYNMTLNLHLSW